jgi:hypothetical protein
LTSSNGVVRASNRILWATWAVEIQAPISIQAVETELPASIDCGYCQSFADYSRDLAGVAIPLPIGDRRLSAVVAGPEFRIGSRTATLKKFADRHRPRPG